MTELSRTFIGRGLAQSLGRSSLRTQGPQRERKALIAAAQTLASALQQRPFFTFEARGYGSLRSQGRPVWKIPYAIALPASGRGEASLRGAAGR